MFCDDIRDHAAATIIQGAIQRVVYNALTKNFSYLYDYIDWICNISIRVKVGVQSLCCGQHSRNTPLDT